MPTPHQIQTTNELFLKQSPTPQQEEQIAMGIVFQIGDYLEEKGIISVDQRQKTNDDLIDYVEKCLSKAHTRWKEQSIKKLQEKIKPLPAIKWKEEHEQNIMQASYNQGIVEAIETLRLQEEHD